MNQQTQDSTQTTEQASDRIALRPDEAFRQLGISRSAGWRLIRSGRMPSLLIGGIRLVPRSDLERWLAQEREQQAS